MTAPCEGEWPHPRCLPAARRYCQVKGAPPCSSPERHSDRSAAPPTPASGNKLAYTYDDRSLQLFEIKIVINMFSPRTRTALEESQVASHPASAPTTRATRTSPHSDTFEFVIAVSVHKLD